MYGSCGATLGSIYRSSTNIVGVGVLVEVGVGVGVLVEVGSGVGVSVGNRVLVGYGLFVGVGGGVLVGYGELETTDVNVGIGTSVGRFSNFFFQGLFDPVIRFLLHQ